LLIEGTKLKEDFRMMLRNTLFGLALAGSLGGCLVSGEAEVQGPAPVATVEVEQEPPPPQQEVVVVRPGFVWVAGRYNWNGARYVWMPGHHERERVGYAWAPGRWERRGRRHVWIEGGWRRR
jgi:hypothetical protein